MSRTDAGYRSGVVERNGQIPETLTQNLTIKWGREDLCVKNGNGIKIA